MDESISPDNNNQASISPSSASKRKHQSQFFDDNDTYIFDSASHWSDKYIKSGLNVRFASIEFNRSIDSIHYRYSLFEKFINTIGIKELDNIIKCSLNDYIEIVKAKNIMKPEYIDALKTYTDILYKDDFRTRDEMNTMLKEFKILEFVLDLYIFMRDAYVSENIVDSYVAKLLSIFRFAPDNSFAIGKFTININNHLLEFSSEIDIGITDRKNYANIAIENKKSTNVTNSSTLIGKARAQLFGEMLLLYFKRIGKDGFTSEDFKDDMIFGILFMGLIPRFYYIKFTPENIKKILVNHKCYKELELYKKNVNKTNYEIEREIELKNELYNLENICVLNELVVFDDTDEIIANVECRHFLYKIMELFGRVVTFYSYIKDGNTGILPLATSSELIESSESI